ncbi:hypothetical protein FTV88_0427 [Heliorestis convoluta]|uniref:Uncharacterized protein n=1 Tax=Heliorestis convoluta TaxID=356322 RepID=A0A5Q2MZH8_9FIRM|nr:hypothetical protein FTV88_0427 [Heliorestis convoluta]
MNISPLLFPMIRSHYIPRSLIGDAEAGGNVWLFWVKSKKPLRRPIPSQGFLKRK